LQDLAEEVRRDLGGAGGQAGQMNHDADGVIGRTGQLDGLNKDKRDSFYFVYQIGIFGSIF
jgi:hypothetical protein